MSIESKKIKYEKFLEEEKNTENLLEFIYEEAHELQHPSVEHQSIVTNLSTELGVYFKGKECRHFVSPFDVIFQNENEIHKVQPDITILCDKENLNKNNYTGTPKILVEVLSPSTAFKDYTKKMNLYMRFGVKEYWIVSPKNKGIQVFILENGKYGEPTSYYRKEILSSSVFEDMKINLENIFI